MNQNRKQQSEPTRASSMEKMRGSGSDSSSSRDRGTSSDRAMFSDRAESEPRGSSSERGRSSETGISNRERSREECEQDQLPERGSSRQSER
jgi:hypothetical protein